MDAARDKVFACLTVRTFLHQFTGETESGCTSGVLGIYILVRSSGLFSAASVAGGGRACCRLLSELRPGHKRGLGVDEKGSV